MVYHHCNETLRDSFYKDNWDIEKCERHSLFVSSASYPIKGFHFMIEALHYILEVFPDTQLYVPGMDLHKTNLLNSQRRRYYDNYISSLITKYDLDEHIHFLGELSESQMKNRFLHSHVFVCCSSIENSPNSLGEAMLLGVPSVASNVGGIASMLDNGVEGLTYPVDEPYMLAHYVMNIFSNDEFAGSLSLNARKRASITHNKENNYNDLMRIYHSISNG